MKKTNQLLALALIAAMAVTTFTSCKKYEDGGPLNKAKKNLTSSWKLDNYFLNGTEATSSLLISGLTEEYTENGSYIRSYVDKDGDFFSETGDWQFDDKKTNIDVSGIGSLELSNNNSSVSASDYTTLRLKNEELWYYFENGGDLHEFHFVTK